ncbi:MAG: hypothetical protein H0X29_06895 [Parachlamydiaceae bacterium]|nr:hypothetical protein [Parachlamydiaceae bacterium]
MTSINAAYVKFDVNGIIGPVLTLLYQPDDQKLDSTSKMIKTNFFTMKGIELENRERFCKDIKTQNTVKGRLQKMMKSDFIKGMYPLKSRCCCQSKSPFHSKIRELVIPSLFMQAELSIPEIGSHHPKKIHEFLTNLYEGSTPEWVIQDECDFQEILNHNSANSAFKKDLESLAKSLNSGIHNKKLTEQDLDIIIKGISEQSIDYLTSNNELVKSLVIDYLSLTATIGENKRKLTQIACRAIERDCRPLYSPPHQQETEEIKTEYSPFLS